MYKSDATVPVDERTRALERVAQAFTTHSLWYDLRGIFLVGFVYRSTVWRQIRFFEGNMSGRHLEVPVGNGTVLGMALRFHALRRRPAPQVAAVDCAESMLTAARRKLKRFKNVSVQYGDVGSLQFEESSFDSVNIANGFHCFPDPAAALAEIRRVLAPKGTVAVNVLLHPGGIWPLRKIAERMNRHALATGMLHGTFSAEDARRLFVEHGFEIESDRVSGNTLYLVARRPAG